MASHFALIAPPMSSHMYVAGALGRELIRRGHKATFIGIRDVQLAIEREEIDFHSIGQTTHPPGRLAEFQAKLAKLQGLPALRLSISEVAEMNATLFHELPGILSRIGADALIADQAEPAGGTVAEYCRLPWATSCAAIPLNREPGIPPSFISWSYSENGLLKLRNRAVYRVIDFVTRKIKVGIDRQRAAWKLSPLGHPDRASSPYLQVAQLLREFDFPRKQLPPCFHYTGPFRRGARRPIPFPWQKLNSGTVVYASLGTLMNRHDIYRVIAEACARAGVQLVLSLGGTGWIDRVGSLPGSPIIVDFAPQEELLQSVQLFITHGGLNSAQEALLAGVPCVVVPLFGDQPAVGARMERIGAGIAIQPRDLTVDRLHSAVTKILRAPEYRDNAKRMQKLMQESGGVELAGQLMESLVRK